MSATPADLFATAKSLAASAMTSESSDDAEIRCATSRLYYSAFHLCKKFHDNLATPGSVGSASGVHAQLVAQLQNPGISAANKKYLISQTLSKSLRLQVNQRVRADYSLASDMSKDDLKGTLAQCEVIHDVCIANT